MNINNVSAAPAPVETIPPESTSKVSVQNKIDATEKICLN